MRCSSSRRTRSRCNLKGRLRRIFLSPRFISIRNPRRSRFFWSTPICSDGELRFAAALFLPGRMSFWTFWARLHRPSELENVARHALRRQRCESAHLASSFSCTFVLFSRFLVLLFVEVRHRVADLRHRVGGMRHGV